MVNSLFMSSPKLPQCAFVGCCIGESRMGVSFAGCPIGQSRMIRDLSKGTVVNAAQKGKALKMYKIFKFWLWNTESKFFVFARKTWFWSGERESMKQWIMRRSKACPPYKHWGLVVCWSSFVPRPCGPISAYWNSWSITGTMSWVCSIFRLRP